MANWLHHANKKPCVCSHARATCERGRGIYGLHKIQSELAAHGIQVGVNRIKSLRKAAGIRCIHKRKFRVTRDSKHKPPVAPNLLGRQFNQLAPNKVWVADMAYIPTDETVKVFPVEYRR